MRDASQRRPGIPDTRVKSMPRQKRSPESGCDAGNDIVRNGLMDRNVVLIARRAASGITPETAAR
jgi:hypothetical protein